MEIKHYEITWDSPIGIIKNVITLSLWTWPIVPQMSQHLTTQLMQFQQSGSMAEKMLNKKKIENWEGSTWLLSLLGGVTVFGTVDPAGLSCMVGAMLLWLLFILAFYENKLKLYKSIVSTSCPFAWLFFKNSFVFDFYFDSRKWKWVWIERLFKASQELKTIRVGWIMQSDYFCRSRYISRIKI